MMKRDELADPRSCLNRAHDEELLFVLRGMDRITRNRDASTDAKIAEAIALAERMEGV